MFEAYDDSRPGTLVAVKAQYQDGEDLYYERKILSGCLADCPGVPTILEEVLESGVSLLIEEPYGIDLDAYVWENSAKVTSHMLQRWAKELTRVVKEVHSRGVVHRDIKPSNIILTGWPLMPGLIDFGCAEDVVHSELFPLFSGTERYASAAALNAGIPCFEDDFASLCYTFYSIEIGLDCYDDRCLGDKRPSIRSLRRMSKIVKYLHRLWGREQ